MKWYSDVYGWCIVLSFRKCDAMRAKGGIEMDIGSFLQNLKEYMPENIYDCKIGTDMRVNTRVVVDEAGWIWVRDAESFKRKRTSVNVQDVVEFRRDDYYTEYGTFYIITTEDNGLEFSIEKGFSSQLDVEIYYCEDGKLSGYGTAVEHFSQFPAGDTSARLDDNPIATDQEC